MSNILYLITCYNPNDVNPLYFDDSSYVYNNIRSVQKIKKISKHSIKVVVSDFGSGDKTIDFLSSLKHKEKWNIDIFHGPDQSGIISINAASIYYKSWQNFDLLFYSVSDAIITKPKDFDRSVNAFMATTGCDFTYINADPGLLLPREDKTINPEWYVKMPFYRNAHFNVCCAKSKYLQAYDNRLLIDIFEGASAEAFVGYMTYAQGGFCRICPIAKYDHIGGKQHTDRKHVYKKGIKARGQSWQSPSLYLQRDINKLVYGGKHCGIHYDPAPFSSYPFDLSEVEKTKSQMLNYIQNNLFLKPQEFDYDSVKVKIL